MNGQSAEIIITFREYTDEELHKDLRNNIKRYAGRSYRGREDDNGGMFAKSFCNGKSYSKVWGN